MAKVGFSIKVSETRAHEFFFPFLSRPLKHFVALNADQRVDVAVDHIGAIDDGDGLTGERVRRCMSSTMPTQSDEEALLPLLRTLPMPSQLHDSAGRHHARLLLQTRLTCRLMQHNWSCMFVFPHLSLCFLHTSVRFLPPIRAGHHPASLAIGRLVGMRLHFLILLRLSSCCGEKGSSICASFVLFSAHVVTFFCNPNA